MKLKLLIVITVLAIIGVAVIAVVKKSGSTTPTPSNSLSPISTLLGGDSEKSKETFDSLEQAGAIRVTGENSYELSKELSDSLEQAGILRPINSKSDPPSASCRGSYRKAVAACSSGDTACIRVQMSALCAGRLP